MVVIKPGRGPGMWPGHSPNDTLIETEKKMVPRATLICRPNSHPFQERHLVLEQPEKVGRSVARARAAPNNAIFDCKVLSRNHALLWYENGKFFLEDTKSSNGTFVNNQRLGKNTEESPPREVCSGDIVQFGVDVMENSKKVTHGCIIATLLLYLPDGKEAKASSTSVPAGPAGPVHSSELYQLQQCVQEAVLREQAVENKLATLQRLLDSVQTATDSSWKALIDEDRLLTRLEILEGQHALYSKNFGDDKLREEIGRLQEDKNAYQSVAKESLKKVLQEKLEAVRKVQELERSLTNADEECQRQTELRDSASKELADLANKHESKLAVITELEAKVKELQEDLTAAEERWETERARQETKENHQRDEQAVNRARLEGLQAENDFTKQQLAALRQKLNNKLAGSTPNGDVGDDGNGMKETEQELESVRQQLVLAETQLSNASQAIVKLKDDINKAENDISVFKERTNKLEAELKESKAEASSKKAEVQELEEKLKELETDLQKLSKQKSAGDTGSNEDSDSDIAELREQVQRIQELLAEARESRTAADGQVERYQSELLVARNNAQEATLRADHLRTQLKESESALAVGSERVDQMQQQVVRLAASVTEAAGHLQQLQQRLTDQQLTADQNRHRADSLQDSLTTAQGRLAESTRECDQLRAQVTQLRGELEALRTEAQTRQQQLDTASARIRELEDRFRACEADRDAAQARCLALEASQAELSASGGERQKQTQLEIDQLDRERAELRTQLKHMDHQLRELAIQNRTMATSNVVAVAVLIVALFVMLLVINS